VIGAVLAEKDPHLVQCQHHPVIGHLLDGFVSRAPVLASGSTSAWHPPWLVLLLKGSASLLPSEAGGVANWELVEEFEAL